MWGLVGPLDVEFNFYDFLLWLLNGENLDFSFDFETQSWGGN